MQINSKKCVYEQTKNKRLLEVEKANGFYTIAVKEGCPTVLSNG